MKMKVYGEDGKLKQILIPPVERKLKLAIIEQIRVLYKKESNNPLLIFKAYQIARENGLEIPEWILQYFDESIKKLDKLINNYLSKTTDKKTIEVFTEAFNINEKGIISKYNDKLIKTLIALAPQM